MVCLRLFTNLFTKKTTITVKHWVLEYYSNFDDRFLMTHFWWQIFEEQIFWDMLLLKADSNAAQQVVHESETIF